MEDENENGNNRRTPTSPQSTSTIHLGACKRSIKNPANNTPTPAIVPYKLRRSTQPNSLTTVSAANHCKNSAITTFTSIPSSLIFFSTLVNQPLYFICLCVADTPSFYKCRNKRWQRTSKRIFYKLLTLFSAKNLLRN